MAYYYCEQSRHCNIKYSILDGTMYKEKKTISKAVQSVKQQLLSRWYNLQNISYYRVIKRHLRWRCCECTIRS